MTHDPKKSAKAAIYDAILDFAKKKGIRMVNGGKDGHDISFSMDFEGFTPEEQKRLKAEMDLVVEEVSRRHQYTIAATTMEVKS